MPTEKPNHIHRNLKAPGDVSTRGELQGINNSVHKIKETTIPSQILLTLVGPVIRPFNFLDQFLGFARLALPFLLAHLEVAIKEFVVRQPVASANAIPEGEELAIVVVEVEVVQSMAGRAIDEWVARSVFTVICQQLAKNSLC